MIKSIRTALAAVLLALGCMTAAQASPIPLHLLAPDIVPKAAGGFAACVDRFQTTLAGKALLVLALVSTALLLAYYIKNKRIERAIVKAMDEFEKEAKYERFQFSKDGKAITVYDKIEKRDAVVVKTPYEPTHELYDRICCLFNRQEGSEDAKFPAGTFKDSALNDGEFLELEAGNSTKVTVCVYCDQDLRPVFSLSREELLSILEKDL